MITESDKKFMDNLQKIAAKEARAKARAERQAALEAEGSVENAGGEETGRESMPADLESEEEVDEITLLIQKEEQELAEKTAAEEAQKKQKAVESE
jgi:hypothetical protein